MKKHKGQLRLKKCILVLVIAALLANFYGLPGGVVFAAGEVTRLLCAEELDEETIQWLDEAGEALGALAAERDMMALVYLADSYPVKEAPSSESGTTVTVRSGQQVNILDFCIDEEFELWYYVRLEYKGTDYYGYVQRAYLAVSDARFLNWEQEYGMSFGTTYALESGEGYVDIEQFPESYRQPLTALKEQHPNWTFVKMNTGLDWNTVIAEEMKGGKSLVYYTFPDWAKNGLYDQGTWYYATEDVLKIYMDPRNGLTEDAIFQFEQLTYNEEYHTLEAIEQFLQNTFMGGDTPAPGMDYMPFSYMFWVIGKEECRKVSPFHLAARVLQEQGSQGGSRLISGVEPGFEGYYNYFNIGATGQSVDEVVTNGLTYAKNHWQQGAYYSVLYGADFISGNYIKKGQDSLYLQKYNVNPDGAYALYTHQYMQNISAPTTEGRSIRRLYESANALESTFVFKIPVFENMPAKACSAPGTEPEEPEENLEFQLTLPEGYTGNSVWLDGVECSGEEADGKLTVVAPGNYIRTAVMYKYNTSGVPTGMYVWSLDFADGAYTVTSEPELEDLLTYHGFSIRITGKSGIRYKSGISADTKNRLIDGGINGYQLKEYGTLVMNNANRQTYPMVLGGTKVKSGMSYGTDANGNPVDITFETVDNRHRFTSVLVGLPVEQYKTEFAFRGYVVLEKNGTPVTIYGPVMARSIYAQAQRYIANQTYEPDTEPYNFLQKIIADADALEAEGTE
ncbi:MAG: hypothetical protein ACI4HQ_08590 [Acetatifactor sp.]